ncbi:MAG TPA: hypothetical protein VHT48_02155 [Methylocella sp.]|nr:hypothetical protein [Methylocella sp.]
MPFPELAYVHIHLGAAGCLKFAPRYKINPAFCHCESVLGALASGLRAPGSARKRKGQAMNTNTMRNSMAFVAGGAVIAGAAVIVTASPSWAMSVLSNTAVRTAASNQVTDVHYYHRGYYRHPYYRHPYFGLRYYRRGYGYPWWYNPYSYYNPYYYYYYYYYYYSYPYSYPFSFGF